MADNKTIVPVIDWYSWDPWSSCSSTCGLGVRWRRRACLKDPRTCPQSSRPNSLLYEKTQLQDCAFVPCVNRTLSGNVMGNGDVGVSVAISAAIIGMVFILAKALHCVTNRHLTCCKKSTGSQPALSEINLTETPPPYASVQGLNGAENQTGPVYITITQEMITGNQSLTPITSLTENSQPLSVSRTAIRVERTISTSSTVNPTDTIRVSSIDSGPSLEVNEEMLSDTPSRNGQEVQTTQGANEASRQQITREGNSDDSPGNSIEEASTSEQANYTPPSYESLFPLFKRNQTL